MIYHSQMKFIECFITNVYSISFSSIYICIHTNFIKKHLIKDTFLTHNDTHRFHIGPLRCLLDTFDEVNEVVNIMNKNHNCAETIDRMNRGVAWGMFICGVTYFINAAEKLVEPGTLNSSLDVAGGIGVVLTMLVTLFAIFPVMKLKMTGAFMLKKEPESFMSDAMHTSFKNSWVATMLFLVLILAFQKPIDNLGIESSFYFIVLFGFMALSASISFFVITREDELEEELEDEELYNE